MRRTLLYTNYLIPCRFSTDPEMYDLGWLWMAWMFIIRNSIGCGLCLRPKILSDIFSFSFTLLLPNWLLISIRIYSGIARFPCDSMAFLFLLYLFICLSVTVISRDTARYSPKNANRILHTSPVFELTATRQRCSVTSEFDRKAIIFVPWKQTESALGAVKEISTICLAVLTSNHNVTDRQ